MVRPRRLARRRPLPELPIGVVAEQAAPHLSPLLEGGRSWTRIGGHR